ncbi:MAG: general secretion pathway protein I [Marinobacter sp. T13-3]|nr:MAG: general secretion pathway protein I [Marinobacter sp. T13-3]
MTAQRGFTLIEVLVALLVFGLLAGAAGSVASNAIGTHKRVEDKTLASWLAQNTITETRLAGTLPANAANTESVEYANRQWQVRTQIAPTEDNALRRVTVTVAQPDSQGEPRPVHTLVAFIESRRQ